MKKKYSVIIFFCIVFCLFSCKNKIQYPEIISSIKMDHPRLLFIKGEEKDVTDLILKDSLLQSIANYLFKEADEIINKPLIIYELDERKTLLTKSRTAIKYILTTSMAFRLSGEKKYKDRAIKELLNISTFKDWNPQHFLDVAEMTTAAAIGYDWLYSEINENIRTSIREAIYNKGILPYFDAYEGENTPFWVTTDNNWNFVCNGGISIGALAIAEHYPEDAGKVIKIATEKIPVCLENYKPDGAWYEGPGYWSYATSYIVLTISAYKSALGKDFNFSLSEGFNNAANYYINSLSPSNQTFNFADVSGSIPNYNFVLFWFSKNFKQSYISDKTKKEISLSIKKDDFLRGNESSDRFFALLLNYYFPDVSTDTIIHKDALLYKGKVETVILKSNDSLGLYLAAKGGNNSENHQQLDIGTFVVESEFIRWGVDMGSDNYSLPNFFDKKQGGQRWKYYRNTNKSHNTLVFGDSIQQVVAQSKIIQFSDSVNPFGVIDLSQAYRNNAEKVLRGVKMIDKKIILVQDEIFNRKNTTDNIRWAFVTNASVNIQDNIAKLTQLKKEFYLRIVEPENIKFTLVSTQAPSRLEKSNIDFKMLALIIKSKDPSIKIKIIMSSDKNLILNYKKEKLPEILYWK